MSLDRPKILFIADAGPVVGGGHVMRSLTLARALAERGAQPLFASSPAVDLILNAFGPDIPREPATSLDPEALCDTLTGIDFDAMVFDHYGLTRAHHEALAAGRPSLAIDDLANRPLGPRLVLDSGPDRKPSDYALLVEGDTRLLLGPDYAPVRPDFVELRAEALARRDGRPVRRIAVALGLTDPGGLTGRVVERLRPRLGEAHLDIVVGAAAPGIRALSRIADHDPRLTLHVDTPDMAWLMTQADLGVGAAGSTIWERCILGLPSLLVTVAENQRPAAAALSSREAALVLDGAAPGFDAAFDRSMVKLIADAPLRIRMSQAASRICDGLGAVRVADAFLEVIRADRPEARLLG